LLTDVLSFFPYRISCSSYSKELHTATAMVFFTGWISSSLIYVPGHVRQNSIF
jgi:hypothetical protein